MTEGCSQYLIFIIEEQHYALELSSVEKVIRSVALILPPDAPPLLLGLLDLGGHITPVMDLRARLGLPRRELEMEDRLVICFCRGKRLAFSADTVQGVATFSPAELNEPQQILGGLPKTVKAVGRRNLDTVLICDLEALFARADIVEGPAWGGESES